MQKQTQLALNAAAWFFVGQSEDMGTCKHVPIKMPFRIGRRPDLEMCLPCKSVSGLHAEIVCENTKLWLCDLESTNGTFVNGKKVNSRTRLRENDTVQFGTTVFHVTQSTLSKSGDSQSNPLDGVEQLLDDQFERLFNGGVVPFFQPIVRVDCDKELVAGYEVLGRSQLFGLQTPAEMFAAASRLELEAELSRELRHQGVKIADQNLPAGDLIFVNTHPAELECDGMKESLFAIRDEYPDRPLMLEVHESVLNNARRFLKLYSVLENLDIQLAFHDFGASQIRMAELSEVCPDVVKFDVKLLQGINGAGSRRQQFVAAMVKMVKELGITPLAECIEAEEEHETIQELGFELGQGFHYGRPTSIVDCVTQKDRSRQPKVKSFLSKNNADSSVPKCESGCVKDAGWLMQQSKHHFTIQVLSAISEKRAKEHVAMQKDPGMFSIFSKQGKTRTLYIVCYGVYEDRTAAKVVAEQLATSTVSPWIRMLSSVQAEIAK